VVYCWKTSVIAADIRTQWADSIVRWWVNVISAASNENYTT
jgi:hypothetical protein